MTINFLRYEFHKRTKSLKLDEQAREELFSRFIVIYNGEFACAYCGKRMELKWGTELSFTIDHIIPRKVGGQDNQNNLAFVCRTCNFLKGDMDIEKYINNMERLIARKNKREYFKARKVMTKDKQTRDAYKDIFERVTAKKGEPNEK